MEIIFGKSELSIVSKSLISEAKDRKVWAFHASMGSGKTTLISEICTQLGANSSASSPTFSVMNYYTTNNGKTICHMDWYRLKNEEEAIRAGVEDGIYENDYCFIEWSENAPNLLPSNTFHIYITVLENETRKIQAQ